MTEDGGRKGLQRRTALNPRTALRLRTTLRLVFLVASVSSAASAQQTLEQRVAAVGSGTVRLSYAAKDSVCGDGRGGIALYARGGTVVHGMSVRTGTRFTGNAADGAAQQEWEHDCEPGPVRLAIDVERRQVTRVRAYVGGRWRGEAERDLGEVPATEASAYLLRLAATADESTAKDAIFPALLADAPPPDRALLDIAKDDSRPREVRKSATFWVAQSAGDRVAEGLQELTSDPDRQVRESAVFSLSQRPNDESVPALIRLARTHRDPGIRRNAVFWLGQKRDPRAIAYFEEVLLGR